MKEHRASWILACITILTVDTALGQGPSAPIVHEPSTSVPQAPQGKIRVRASLVNVPVTVTNREGELVSNLDAKDFQVMDNGVPQKIAYLDLGRAPLLMVLLVETSSRVEPLLPDMRKTGIIFADVLMGQDDEAAVLGFNNSVDKLTDFTTNHETIFSTMSELKCGT